MNKPVLFICSSVVRYLGCCCFFAVMNSVVMNMFSCPLGIPRSGIAGLYGNFV